MSTLNSASTRADTLAAYKDTASYAEDGDAGKARAFITACRLLLLILPKRAMHGGTAGGEQIDLNPELIAAQITEAKRWLIGNDTSTPQTTYSDFSNFRQ